MHIVNNILIYWLCFYHSYKMNLLNKMHFINIAHLLSQNALIKWNI